MAMRYVWEHLYLVSVAFGFNIVIGLILGILAYLVKFLRPGILWTVDILQTVPVLALLGMIMLVFGANSTTVIIGIVLYSLLPIVRNTFVGLVGISPSIKEAAKGMGMTNIQRLIQVELPLSFPIIFTGLRIALVTSIGIAVFGAFVGGGGLGATINRAILLQDMSTLMQATGTLMIMAIGFDLLMGSIEKRLKSRKTVG
ncbi:ABC transporter permease [Alkalibacter saccharofermentans]|uniref:Osmoprotectant transport system permease protein n=1 Tax=Alkalibacter saccharofermentans DSM 14828 TaxID=1120975 RepID=A0A1M4U0V5_9FIRM|nr:ABC transporter permease [Alkalibacter saccharofermentans]SHE50411.1 osmoprotectant transport system permease protein [Alkalibacter saccharofermentans DSM 14828]